MELEEAAELIRRVDDALEKHLHREYRFHPGMIYGECITEAIHFHPWLVREYTLICPFTFPFIHNSSKLTTFLKTFTFRI